MSYEPTLIIKYNDLKNIEGELEEEQYSTISDEEKVAKFLLEELRFPELLPTFENIKIILSKPELSNFNSLVRERLTEGNVYYVTFI